MAERSSTRDPEPRAQAAAKPGTRDFTPRAQAARFMNTTRATRPRYLKVAGTPQTSSSAISHCVSHFSWCKAWKHVFKEARSNLRLFMEQFSAFVGLMMKNPHPLMWKTSKLDLGVFNGEKQILLGGWIWSWSYKRKCSSRVSIIFHQLVSPSSIISYSIIFSIYKFAILISIIVEVWRMLHCSNL